MKPKTMKKIIAFLIGIFRQCVDFLTDLLTDFEEEETTPEPEPTPEPEEDIKEPEIDLSELKKLLEKAKAIDRDNYDSSWLDLQHFITAGEEAIENPTKENVEEAIKLIQDGISKLKEEAETPTVDYKDFER